ncbi:MAG: DUF2461 domain-containing protein [Acidimicrobiia bacterium]|nr:DUF2461 domain-containing protein [Acidimicrobiia bacterium]MDH4307348.1 DUF2461 domain-containing protein [Acidimicrobiia bacterium]MDH5294648.1 DUF2461 domain-containing protein [Acidimicrobiia bacterium]
MFDGFTKQGLELLTRLPTLDKDRFAAVKKQYTAEIAEPAKEFVDALGGELAGRISNGIEYAAKTNGSISPINNDLRFNPEAAPYKDHLLFRFWEGPNKKTAPTLFVRLSAEDVGFATGVVFDPVDRARQAIDSDGADLRREIDALVRQTKGEVAGADLKRVPKPYPQDHPQAELLKHTWLQVRWLTRSSRTGSGLLGRCVDQLEKAGSVHRWLVDHLS